MPEMILTPEERFQFALNFLLKNEGGYSNDPADPGGETNLGITQEDLNKWHQQIGLPATVKELTLNDAAKFYKTLWWDKYHYGDINSLTIATKIFDLAVNIGAQKAQGIAQKSLNQLGYKLKVDGILGGQTLSAINECCLQGQEEALLNAIRNNAEGYYKYLVQKNPHLKKFLKGWLIRAAK